MGISDKEFDRISTIGITLSMCRDENSLLDYVRRCAKEIMQCGETVLYLQDGGGKQYGSREPGGRGETAGSLLRIPMENSEGQRIGTLCLRNARDGEGNAIPFDGQKERMLRSFCSLAAIQLTNLRYIEEIKAQLRSFVEAMATAIDERTPYNGSHTRKVAQYALLIADKLHEKGAGEAAFDEAGREKLELAALLHDIGKMVVPRSIMNRATRLDGDMKAVEQQFQLLSCLYEIDFLKGRLSKGEYDQIRADLQADLALIHRIDGVGYLEDEDYERVRIIAGKAHVSRDGVRTPYLSEKQADCLSIRRGTLTEEARKEMESHVVMTSKILSKVRFHKNYEDVPKWAAEHHEFIDGTGYPRRLSGAELPIEARILTVADIYDALTARDRPYKKPMPKEEAFRTLREMAGEGKVELRLVDLLEEAVTDRAVPVI